MFVSLSYYRTVSVDSWYRIFVYQTNVKDTWYSRSFNNRNSYETTMRCFSGENIRKYSWSNDYYYSDLLIPSLLHNKYIIIQVDIEFKFTRELINYYVDRLVYEIPICIKLTVTSVVEDKHYFHVIFPRLWFLLFLFRSFSIFWYRLLSSLIAKKFRWKLLFDFDKRYNYLKLYTWFYTRIYLNDLIKVLRPFYWNFNRDIFGRERTN